MIAIESLGQEQPATVTYFRPMVLQKAVTYVLGQEPGFESFPGTHYTIDKATVTALGKKVADWSNNYPVKWKQRFTVEEGEGVVRQRGYSDMFPENVINYYGGMPPPLPGYTPATTPTPTITPTRATVIQDAVSSALRTSGLTVFPSGVWNIPQTTLKRVTDRAYIAAQAAGYSVGYSAVESAVLERGYRVSELDPFTRQPITITAPVVLPATPPPLPPVIQIPQPPPQPVMIVPQSPAIQRVTVTMPQQFAPVPVAPLPLPPPEPVTIWTQAQQPVIRIPAPPAQPEAEAKPKTGLIVAAAFAVVALSRIA